MTANAPGGLRAVQYYPLRVRTNSPPAISAWNPPATATAGGAYRYDVQASDPDGDPLTYALTNPAGSGNNIMAIDAYGRITWTPTAGKG